MQKRKLKKIPFIIEDVKKPIIVRAHQVTPKRMSRTELKKLEEQILKNIVDKKPGSVVVSIETSKVFIKQKNGGVKVIPIMKADMKKIEELIKKSYREINR